MHTLQLELLFQSSIHYHGDMNTLARSMCLGFAAICAAVSPAWAAEPTDEAAELARWSADRDQRLAWWREARFGMFIHWGLYSAAGGSWNGKEYSQHYAEWIQNWAAVPCDEYARTTKPLFTPDPGVADAWADLAREAGMRYAVMTSKHHDGFTLFNSQQEYSRSNAITGGTNISPGGRDLAREFVDSMRSRGLRAGFYYSLLDWQHPDAYEMALPAYPKSSRQRDHATYVSYVRGHVDELLSNYGPLCTIWFDYSDKQRQGAAWGAAGLLADMRAKQQGILVNNRLFEGLENKNGDYGTPEKYVPPTGLPGMDWEVNHTLNESYGYSAHDATWKDTTTVVRLLCDVVSKGGNLLLNIGPDAHGKIPEPARATLRGVGAWMNVNSESIYATSASPFARLPWGCATQKPGVLYLMVFTWPADGRLVVPMRGVVKSARVLGRDGELSFGGSVRDGQRLEIRLPDRPFDPSCSVVKLELEGDVLPMPFVAFPGSDGVLTLLPHDASIEGPSLRVEQVGAVEDVKYNLGYWLDANAKATFPVGISDDQQGEYVVEVNVACADASAGTRMRLETPAGDLAFTVPGTGGWQQYRVVTLGNVKLQAGEHRLVLAALTKPAEAAANVRSITLRKR
jgi:alpha-L-fucosidase